MGNHAPDRLLYLDEERIGKVGVGRRGPPPPVAEQFSIQRKISPDMTAWLAAVCRRSCRRSLPSVASSQTACQ